MGRGCGSPPPSFQPRLLAPDLLFLGWNGAEMLPSYAVARGAWPGARAAVARDGEE